MANDQPNGEPTDPLVLVLVLVAEYRALWALVDACDGLSPLIDSDESDAALAWRRARRRLTEALS